MFQLALAAQEMGLLERLYCSMVDLPGKWGALLARLHRTAAMLPVGASCIEEPKITEVPLPLLSRRLHGWLHGNKPSDYFESNDWFDRSVARRLAQHTAGIFVGAETCAQHSLTEARRLGMACVLDCPGIPSPFLAEQVAQAAEELQITVPTASLSSRMLERKTAELDLADVILLCSEFQRDCFVQQGVDGAKLRVNPLWSDAVFSSEATISHAAMPSRTVGPLRALFVGGGNVAKGAPYAILAAKLAGDQVSLTFCGGVDATVRAWAGSQLEKHRIIPWLPRQELASVYREHDVLIFPTLGDSFGFVAYEAMACGLPVIASTHAGAPLPDESWRVPVRQSEALAKKLLAYASDRALLQRDSMRALSFVRAATTDQFRKRAQAIFRSLA